MKNELIIIVEYDLLIAKSLHEMLESEGFRVLSNYTNYSTAIEAIELHNPDMVLVDVHLSEDLEGIKIGKYLHRTGKIPFIYVTTCTDGIVFEKIKNTRPYGFLMKPLRKTDLVANVSLILNNFKHKKIDPLRIEKKTINDAPFRIRNVIDYINENIYEKIEVSELAEVSRWKVHHFIRIFSNVMGTTPYKYILERKMELAKTLIEKTSQPIQEISYDLNFQNYSNFYLAFRKMYNISPEAYRKNKNIDNFIFNKEIKHKSSDYF